MQARCARAAPALSPSRARKRTVGHILARPALERQAERTGRPPPLQGGIQPGPSSPLEWWTLARCPSCCPSPTHGIES